MNRNQLRRLCQQTFRELDLHPPLDVQLLCDRLGQRRARPIIIAASDDLAGRRRFGFRWDDPCADAVRSWGRLPHDVDPPNDDHPA